ncbi:MAG: cell division protein SepF [Candidatus Thermoplasmatota archaeon]|nr:cell division protein SepF [Candidatus Thermoplasmatota archaeon]
MAILKRKSQKEDEDRSGSRKFIDLNDYKFQEEKEETGSTIRVAEIGRLEDIRKISSYIYDGDILVLDCSSISSEEYMMRRITEEIKRVVKDINGDVAGISKSYLIVSPPGTVIDRNRIKSY